MAPKIYVCAACLRRSCWEGEFYCDEYQTADLVLKSLEDLEELKLEDESYYLPLFEQGWTIED